MGLDATANSDMITGAVESFGEPIVLRRYVGKTFDVATGKTTGVPGDTNLSAVPGRVHTEYVGEAGTRARVRTYRMLAAAAGGNIPDRDDEILHDGSTWRVRTADPVVAGLGWDVQCVEEK